MGHGRVALERRRYKDRAPQYDSPLYRTLLDAIGSNLAVLRAKREWSQAEAAARCHMTLWQYQRIEGAITNPTLTSLVRVMDGFGVSLTSLLGDAARAPGKSADDAATARPPTTKPARRRGGVS